MHDILMASATLFSGVTTVVVVTLAFKWGRWSGVVDERLNTYDQRFDTLEQRLERRESRR